jgi:hypothetical protein
MQQHKIEQRPVLNHKQKTVNQELEHARAYGSLQAFQLIGALIVYRVDEGGLSASSRTLNQWLGYMAPKSGDETATLALSLV